MLVGYTPFLLSERPSEITLLNAQNTTTTGDLTAPNGILNGDLLIAVQGASDGNDAPNLTNPTGFSQAFVAGEGGGWDTSVEITYKIADGTESGDTITFGNDGSESNHRILWHIRAPYVITSVATASDSNITNGNPASATSTAGGAEFRVWVGAIAVQGTTPTYTTKPTYTSEYAEEPMAAGIVFHNGSKDGLFTSITVNKGDQGTGNQTIAVTLTLSF